MINKKKTIYFTSIIIVIVLIGLYVFFFKNNYKIEPKIYRGSSAIEVAERAVRENSVDGLGFTLEKYFEDGNYVFYNVIPTGEKGKDIDKARVLLKKFSGEYVVIGFGTAFPELIKAFLELDGKI